MRSNHSTNELCEVAAQGTIDTSLNCSYTGGHALCTISSSRPSTGHGITTISPKEAQERITSSGEVMDERIPHLQDRQFMEHADFLG